MYRVLQGVIVTALILGSGGLAHADTIDFQFNPADFFDFRDHSEGRRTGGGMFKLYETGGFPNGSPTYESWTEDGWILLNNLRASLDDVPSDEGIGYVQAFLLKEPDKGTPTMPVTDWGQTLSTSVAPSGTASDGWEFMGTTDGSIAWILQWQAQTADDYVLPGEKAVQLGISLEPNGPVTVGEEYTLWFGGDNWPGYVPGISFGTFTDGFASVHPTGLVGTAYETSVVSTAIPEPSSIAILAGVLLALIGIASRRRWRHKS